MSCKLSGQARRSPSIPREADNKVERRFILGWMKSKEKEKGADE